MKLNIIAIISFITLVTGTIAAQSSPAGREWRLTYINGTDITNTSASLAIDADGKHFTGNTGCNIMNGSVLMLRNSIRFTPVITTKRACTRRTAVVEASVLSALNRATRYQVTQDRLRIYAGDRLRLQFDNNDRAADDDEAPRVADQLGLDDRRWILESIAGAPIPKVEEEAFIVFDPVKGSAGGNTSCNVYGGSYTANGDKLSITDTISTMRACIEDKRMDIEREFLDALRQTDHFEIRADKLMLYRRNKLLLTFQGRKK